jgi:hypothetical protein
MAQWLVMQGDTKFPVSGLAELEDRARRGELRSGDMIQPPGTTDWLYVTEVPELKELIERYGDDDDDARGGGLAMLGGAALAGVAAVAAVGFVLLIAIGGGTMLYLGQRIDQSSGPMIGEGGLTYSQMIVTAEGSGLRASPEDSASITTSVAKESTLELLGKRGSFYRARTSGGAEGWIPANQVIPMYQLGGAAVRDEYDPLYNPDQYVEVLNSRWMQLPADKPGKMELTNITAFEFMISNESKYPMADLTLLATIKDAQGHELERVEIPVEGVVPPDGTTFVGTLSAEEVDKKGKRPRAEPPTEPDRVMTTFSFEKMAVDDPDLQLRWTSGVEVEMKTTTFANAEIHILELRAVPDDAAVTVVRR